MEEITLKDVHNDLETLKKLVINMREYLSDCFLTAEEENNLEKARDELQKDETISLEELKLELE